MRTSARVRKWVKDYDMGKGIHLLPHILHIEYFPPHFFTLVFH